MPMTTETAAARDALGEQTRAQLYEANTCDPAGKTRLHDQVVGNHLWLADGLARRYCRPNEDLDDLQQVARTGLVQAVRRYDPEQGPFTAFAVPTITGVLKRHFRDHGWLVRPPRRTQELSAQMRQQWPELTQKLHGAPSQRQVADSIGAPLEAVREAMCANQGYRSDSLEVAGAYGAADAGGGDDIGRCEDRLMLHRALRQLTAEERRLLVLRFYEERSQSDIAARLGTSQMQVSRLLARTLRRLRTMIGGVESLDLAS